MSLRLSLCFINRHQPDRKRVQWDGLHYQGTCHVCQRPIIRLRRGVWVKHAESSQLVASPTSESRDDV